MAEINEKQALNGVVSAREGLEGGYIIPKGEKGDKGDPFIYEDFTPEQLALLTGPKGEKGDKGDRGLQGLKGDKGDKGDPGGVNVAIVKEEGLDLNDFVEAGIWFFASSYTPLNIPSGNNGWLEVFTSNTINTIKQIWYRSGTANSNDFQTFVRTRTSGVWSSWKQFAMVEDTGWKNAVLQDGVVAHAKRWKQCSSVQKSRRQSVNKRSSRDSMGWNNS